MLKSYSRLPTDSSFSSSACAGPARAVCNHGTKCYRRNPEHNEKLSHPGDPDYLRCCREAGKTPEFVSIRKLFEWCDASRTSNVSREEITPVWDVIQKLGEGVGDLDDDMWNTIDDDGNGHINFSEFAEFTTKYKVGLPLGVDDLFGTSNAGAMRCGVFDCRCRNFTVQRRRCKYGDGCYQKGEDHRAGFCHPCDKDWERAASSRDESMCVCGHKLKLHSSAATGAGAVRYPPYWVSETDASESEFCAQVPVRPELLVQFQCLMNATYSDVTTRDRVAHCKTWMVPRSYTIVSAMRNENSKLWRKYMFKKALLQKEQLELEYKQFDDVLTTRFWESSDADGETLDKSINEWYLFHGTSASAARNICQMDFKMRLAGSSTGTLYGRGCYLAESITKADEYSKEESGVFTVLLCRVLGGSVRYCDDPQPNAEELTFDCVQGPCDCIMGDRKKVSGTYREIVVFDTENVYPEYILTYRRGEFFKSPSHP